MYTIQQPIFGALSPRFRLRFDSVAEAEAYLGKLRKRMESYIDLKKNGHKVGQKTLEELELELKQIDKMEIVKI